MCVRVCHHMLLNAMLYINAWYMGSWYLLCEHDDGGIDERREMISMDCHQWFWPHDGLAPSPDIFVTSVTSGFDHQWFWPHRWYNLWLSPSGLVPPVVLTTCWYLWPMVISGFDPITWYICDFGHQWFWPPVVLTTRGRKRSMDG